MRHIASKAEFYDLSRRLLLGNRLRQWTWEEFEQLYPECVPKRVGVRHVNRAFGRGNSQLMSSQAAYLYGSKYLYGLKNGDVLFDEGAPHEHLTIQGEVMATERGLYLRYSHLQCHQRVLWQIDREGFRNLSWDQLPCNNAMMTLDQTVGCGESVVKHVWGLKASAILQQYMDVESWQRLNVILGCQLGEAGTWGEREVNFIHPVVEFACFRVPVGVLSWNTLTWEVRTCY